jgi:hypothetical protein
MSLFSKGTLLYALVTLATLAAALLGAGFVDGT